MVVQFLIDLSLYKNFIVYSEHEIECLLSRPHSVRSAVQRKYCQSNYINIDQRSIFLRCIVIEKISKEKCCGVTPTCTENKLYWNHENALWYYVHIIQAIYALHIMKDTSVRLSIINKSRFHKKSLTTVIY